MAPALSRSEFQRRALELFKERSFSQVSMRELAAHVGISPAGRCARVRLLRFCPC
ncbi:TetR family transcriptional regulator [Pseudomonas sp. MAFF 311096]|uniref:TetR family transcriptional regulator n=2 Tax=Pseudomonas TaxID=286 RepID=A0ABS8QP22_9PSED|nr:TetR family transcriptional regulator [Pseudomonas petroselini]MCD7037148.1 TetR family transcriptional regulator [Pseudomonas petroselini]MCD7066695.1 TetR family transcriptional regulator [Pseudomonas petroselini]